MSDIYFSAASVEHQKREKKKAQELRKSLWWRQEVGKGICYHCQKKFNSGELTMDHLIPIARGGMSDKKNCVPSCKTCNTEKGYKTRAELEMQNLSKSFEQSFYESAQEFVQKVERVFDEERIYLKHDWEIDHLCYRVESQERYEELKNEFSKFSELLIESLVNGRNIATYRLQEPIPLLGFDVELVELPAPKPGKLVQEGFEHFEIVAPSDNFDELSKEFANYKQDKGGLAKALNPELEICLEEFNFKFHPISLAQVIEIEKDSK